MHSWSAALGVQTHPGTASFCTLQEDWRGEILQLSWAPRSFVLKGFLSEEECDHLIKLAKPSMSKSSVADNKTGKSFASEIRTSTGTFLSRRQDPIVAAIEQRVSQVTKVPVENQEGMQILHYENGRRHHQHHDYFNDAVNLDPMRGGQRLVTMHMYLTTPEEGGETAVSYTHLTLPTTPYV